MLRADVKGKQNFFGDIAMDQSLKLLITKSVFNCLSKWKGYFTHTLFPYLKGIGFYLLRGWDGGPPREQKTCYSPDGSLAPMFPYLEQDIGRLSPLLKKKKKRRPKKHLPLLFKKSKKERYKKRRKKTQEELVDALQILSLTKDLNALKLD